MQIPLKQYWDLLKKYLLPQWQSAMLLAIFLISSIALKLINPQIIREFIDVSQAGETQEVLFQVALKFLILALIQQVVTVIASYIGEKVAWTATNSLRIDLAAHCLNLDLSFHNAYTPGEMIERVDGDINNLANFFSRFVIELIGNTVLMIGVISMMWWENWLIGLGLTVFVTVSMYIMMRYRNVAVPHWAAERQASADFYGFLEERLAGTEDIRANGAESYVLRNFHKLIREMLRKSLKSAMVINIIININQFLYAAGTAAAFAIATYLFRGELVSIGTVYLIYHYTAMLNRPMDNIAHEIEHLQRAGAGIVRIQELLNIKGRIDEPAISSVADSIPIGKALALQFNNVTFGYDDSIGRNGKSKPKQRELTSKEIVLNDISFSLEPGKVLGLLGRTGSGKTTLTRLIFRFYDPDNGSVSIGTHKSSTMVDIRSCHLNALRQRVGMVTQNIQLFNASVRNNLTFFDLKIPDKKIEEVIFDLGLGNWFNSLPDGLDTLLESGGGGLSAGEAQLLAFARIFLFNPGLIVLDEASSRLDPVTDKLIDDAIQKLTANRTAIIIAHRLGTVQKADQIMILEKGSIIEFGDRTKLISSTTSKFSRLLQNGLEEMLV
jgi:ABC-type multidrug transport system fused ATPase/permease subunit